MNFMGMGLAEIAVVLVVAFLVLGPNRAINLARTAGKLMADLRRTFSEVATAVSMEERAGAASPWESRPADQSQSTQDRSAPVEFAPVDFVPEGSGPQGSGPDESEPEGSAPAGSDPDESGQRGLRAKRPEGPAPTKNGDE